MLLRRYLVQKEKHWAGGKQFIPDPWPRCKWALCFGVSCATNSNRIADGNSFPPSKEQECKLCIRTCLHCGNKHVLTHVCVTTGTLHLCWITYTVMLGTISKLRSAVHRRVKKHGRFFILFLNCFWGERGGQRPHSVSIHNAHICRTNPYWAPMWKSRNLCNEPINPAARHEHLISLQPAFNFKLLNASTQLKSKSTSLSPLTNHTGHDDALWCYR